MRRKRPGVTMRARPELDFRVQWAAFGALVLILVCWFGFYAVRQVGGYWRHAVEAERISREYPRR